MLTVGITTYNIDKYISEFLDSLLSQTYQDFEVIIVDDKSTDDTINIIKDYQLKYPEKLEYIIMETNSGAPSYTRNIILNSNKINGEYIIFLDGDDILEKYF